MRSGGRKDRHGSCIWRWVNTLAMWWNGWKSIHDGIREQLSPGMSSVMMWRVPCWWHQKPKSCHWWMCKSFGVLYQWSMAVYTSELYELYRCYVVYEERRRNCCWWRSPDHFVQWKGRKKSWLSEIQKILRQSSKLKLLCSPPDTTSNIVCSKVSQSVCLLSDKAVARYWGWNVSTRLGLEREWWRTHSCHYWPWSCLKWTLTNSKV